MQKDTFDFDVVVLPGTYGSINDNDVFNATFCVAITAAGVAIETGSYTAVREAIDDHVIGKVTADAVAHAAILAAPDVAAYDSLADAFTDTFVYVHAAACRAAFPALDNEVSIGMTAVLDTFKIPEGEA